MIEDILNGKRCARGQGCEFKVRARYPGTSRRRRRLETEAGGEPEERSWILEMRSRDTFEDQQQDGHGRSETEVVEVGGKEPGDEGAVLRWYLRKLSLRGFQVAGRRGKASLMVRTKSSAALGWAVAGPR